MKTFNELSAGVVHWVFAGVISAIIASAIAWGLVQFFLTNHESEKNRARCFQSPCYNELNKRLISVESSLKAEIAAKTDKRYRADDAERDQRILRKEIADVRNDLRKEIADVRTEVNMRIDKLHEEVHK